jgi:hypothetical protein
MRATNAARVLSSSPDKGRFSGSHPKPGISCANPILRPFCGPAFLASWFFGWALIQTKGSQIDDGYLSVAMRNFAFVKPNDK